MPESSRYARFLLRGSFLLISLLTLWWLLLLDPMLATLRGSVEIFGSLVFGDDSRRLVSVTPTGDWSLHVPLKFTVRNSSQPGGPTEFSSIEFDIARSDAIAFTFSLPVLWAITLAVPGIRRSLRPLVVGTVLMAALEIFMLLAFMEISARNAAMQLGRSVGDVSRWVLHFGDYLVVNVIPYTAPFVIATCVHPGLRNQVIQWQSGPVIPASSSARRGRRPS